VLYRFIRSIGTFMNDITPIKNPQVWETTSLAMSEKRRKFSREQKIQILQLVKMHGVTRVLEQYKLSYSVYYRWKQNSDKYVVTINMEQAVEELKKLREENKALKRIIADFALQIEMKHHRAND